GLRLFKNPQLFIGLTAAVAVLFVVFMQVAPQETMRLKGETLRLEVYASHNGAAAKPHDPKNRLVAGDGLMVFVTAPRDGYAMLVDFDERGKISPYWAPRDQSSALTAGRTHESFGSAIELDDFVGSERIFLIFSPRPLELENVRSAFDRAFAENGRHLE